MNSNPIEPIAILRDRIAEKVREMGVDLVQFSLPNVPPPGEEPVFMGVFVIADQAKYQGDVDDQIDQHNFDQMFAGIVEDFQEQAADDTQRQVKERMAQRLKDLEAKKNQDGDR